MVARPTNRRCGARAAILLILASAALGACANGRAPAVTMMQLEPPEPEPAWRSILNEQDMDRLQRVDEAWKEALDIAEGAGFGRRVRNEGDLLDPEAGQPRAALPPGSYRCRLIRIGAAPRGRRAYVSTTDYFCHVGAAEDYLSFTKQTGTDKPGGYLYDDTDRRSIFIGARAMNREETPPAYGDRPDRDVAGIVERIGPFRYRLVVPFPPNGAKLDVYELVPAID